MISILQKKYDPLYWQKKLVSKSLSICIFKILKEKDPFGSTPKSKIKLSTPNL